MIHQYHVHPKNHLRGGHQKQTFLSTVERELFINIERNYVKYNPTKDEQRSLTTWRTFLFNPDGNFILR